MHKYLACKHKLFNLGKYHKIVFKFSKLKDGNYIITKEKLNLPQTLTKTVFPKLIS